jgi:MFS family permease
VQTERMQDAKYLLAAGAMTRPLLALFVVGLGGSLAAKDLAVNVAFPAVTAAFDLETRAIRWLVVCYVVTYASLMLAFGNLGDHVGHQRVFAGGLVVSIAAFVLCAAAPTYPTLLIARFVQGIGTALVVSCAPALATFALGEVRRTQALAGYSAIIACAAVLAPVAGGIAIAFLGWSGVFWFRAPLALAALCLLPFAALPPASHSGSLRSFEIVGPTLLAFGLAALLLAPSLLQAPGAAGWAVVPALAGAGALGAFGLQQRRAARPVLPAAAMRDLDFVLRNAAAVAVHFVAFAVPLLLPYYLADVAGYPPLAIGLVIAASPAGMLLGSLLAAPAARGRGAGRASLLGALCVAGGSLAVAFSASTVMLPAIVASLALHGLGLGLFQVAYTDSVVSALPLDARGVAGSLTMVTRTVGVVSAAAALTAAVDYLHAQIVGSQAVSHAVPAAVYESVFFWLAAALAALLVAGCLRRSLWFAA